VTGGVGRNPCPINGAGTNLLVLTSPCYECCKKYKNRWYAEYLVGCPPGHLVYVDNVKLDTRGKLCKTDGYCISNGECSCWDYIKIDRHGFGTFEIDECDNLPKDITVGCLGERTLGVIFRTGERNNDGKKWVEDHSGGTLRYFEGFQMFVNCFSEFCPTLSDPDNGEVEVTGNSAGDEATYTCNTGYTLNGDKKLVCQNDGEWSAQPPLCTSNERRKRYPGVKRSTVPGDGKSKSECGIEKSSTSYKSLFPTVYTTELNMAKDLTRFHESWQRMSRQPGAELVIEYILYNQTVNYMDNTILIMDPLNHVVAKYNQVKFMKTFDSTGTTEYYIGGVRHRNKPHFTGPGQ
jgi:hypothetical protein